MLSSRTLTRGSPRNPSVRLRVYLPARLFTSDSGRCRAAATRASWSAAFCGEMYGSSPDPDVVTASGGTLDSGTPLNLAYAALRALTFCSSVLLLVSRFDAPE